MPIATSYPGVYIEELPSGVRSIIGVPTSITAFVGTAPCGPDNYPKAIGSLLEYERFFGSVDATPMAMAVSLFFQNGGSSALVVRVTGEKEDYATDLKPPTTGPVLRALYKGAWGTDIRVRFDTETPAKAGESYNLTIRRKAANERGSGQMERYLAISPNLDSPRSLERMLRGSRLVATADGRAAGLPTAHPNAEKGKDPFADPQPPPQATPRPTATPAPTAGPGETSAPTATPTPRPTAAPTPPVTFTALALTPAALAGTPALEDMVADDCGINVLNQHDVFFNLLVIASLPDGTELAATDLAKAAAICQQKRAMLLVDGPTTWRTTDQAMDGRDEFFDPFGENARNAAVFFPRLDLGEEGRKAGSHQVPPSGQPATGAIAGLYARTDAERGIWKAPAGIDTRIAGAVGLTVVLDDAASGRLNPVGINALRSLPIIGNVIWGARTMDGADIIASQWKYVPIRRLALYIEESLYRGTQWVVFEPNDEPLWAQIRLNIGAFMHTLYRRGAFQGASPRDAYFVKCDKETTTQADIDAGVVNIVVGFAPLKPAEFVVIQLQQISPPIET
jgi:phage tail sheath protein FI